MTARTFEQEEFLTRLGELIRARREMRGMSQAQLAERIGLARCSVVNIEAGRQDIPVSRLAMITTVLGIRTGDLP